MILLIDNYDSFVYNLARYLQRLGQRTLVVRNDAIDVAEVRRIAPAALVLSPGPCAPGQAGCSLEIVRRFHEETPILGVCLGHQTIAEALGARILRAAEPVHGRASLIHHDGLHEFRGVPNPTRAGRYHSLVVEEDTLPDSLQVSARAADGVVMGIRHATRPVVGWQFHPESILTECGYALLAGFLRLAGLPVDAAPSLDHERSPPALAPPQTETPVTF